MAVVAEAEDFTAAVVVEVEDSAEAEDFLADMGLAAAGRFAVVVADSPAAVPSAVALAGVHFAVAATSDAATAVSVGAAGMDVGTGAATGLYSASATDTRIIIPTITTLIPILITLTHIPTATIHTPTIPMLTAIPVTATIRMASMEARKRGL
jgi:hypothetical protein